MNELEAQIERAFGLPAGSLARQRLEPIRTQVQALSARISRGPHAAPGVQAVAVDIERLWGLPPGSLKVK